MPPEKTPDFEMEGNTVVAPGGSSEDTEYEEWPEDDRGSVDSLSFLGLSEGVGKNLGVRRGRHTKGKGRGRGSWTVARREAAESAALEADARLMTAGTMKLASAVTHLFDKEGSVQGVPVGELGASIAQALDSIGDVSRKSKGLKGTAVKSLKTAVGVIKTAADELQRRHCEMERGMRESDLSGAADLAHLWRAERAEAETVTLRREVERVRKEDRDLRRALDEERSEPFASERGAGPSPPMRMEIDGDGLRRGAGN